MPLPIVVPVLAAGAGYLWGKRKEILGGIGDVKRFADQLGRLEDAITVKVSGTPVASKADLYWLAAATAFGMVRRLTPEFVGPIRVPPPGMIAIDYDAESREVTFQLRYSQSLMTITTMNNATTTLGAQPVFTGPSDRVVGGRWGFVPAVMRGSIPTPTATGAPPGSGVLPLSNRTVLTGSGTVLDPIPIGITPTVNPFELPVATAVIPTPNPRPLGDARSRGSLCWLVYQSLATPAEFGTHTYDLPNNTNRFSGG